MIHEPFCAPIVGVSFCLYMISTCGERYSAVAGHRSGGRLEKKDTSMQALSVLVLFLPSVFLFLSLQYYSLIVIIRTLVKGIMATHKDN